MFLTKRKTVTTATAVAGVTRLLAMFLLGGLCRQPTQAQPPAAVQPPAVGRYQISSFGYQRSDGSTLGAYILDTQTGEVFQVVGKNSPELIGSVAKAQPKK